MKSYLGKTMVLMSLCVVLLSGCDSWKREAANVSTFGENIFQEDFSQSDPLPDEDDNEDFSDLDEEIADEGDAELISATVTSRSDESIFLSTADEMLARKLYDLITYQNERFSEKFDEREYDYLAVFTDTQEQEEQFYLWINFQRENEIIVENEQGIQWNLSIEDSDHLRAMLS